jgi:hypothetical protein
MRRSSNLADNYGSPPSFGHQRCNPRSKDFRLRQQAQHQPIVLSKFEEGFRMHRDATPFEQPDHRCLSSCIGWRALLLRRCSHEQHNLFGAMNAIENAQGNHQ